MGKRRDTSLEINFDGLTDTITNLVGSLILLVVLVIAATRPKVRGLAELPAPDKSVGAERAIDPLLEELSRMRTQIEGVDGEIQRMEARVPELAGEIRQLRADGEASE